MLYDPMQQRTYFTMLEDDGTSRPAKYILFNVDPITNEPQIFGTMGRGQPVQRSKLLAAPHDEVPLHVNIDTEDYSMFTAKGLFHGLLNRALEGLGDYGVMVDVYRLRQEYAKAAHLSASHDEVMRLEREAQAARNDWLEKYRQFEEDRNAVRRRLRAAAIHSRIYHALQNDRLHGEVQNISWFRPAVVPTSGRVHRLRGGCPSPASSTVSYTPTTSDDEGEMEYGERSYRQWSEAQRRNRCSYCRFTGHWSARCEQPHIRCWRADAHGCQVRRSHERFNWDLRGCKYRGRPARELA